MDGIVKLAAAVFAEIAALERVKALAPQVILAVVLALLASATATGAVGCGLVALWIGLLPVIGPWGAPLVCAGVLLIAAVALMGGVYWLPRSCRRPPATTSAIAAALDTGEFVPLLREHKWLLIGMAVLGGVIAAGNIGQRSHRNR